MLVFANRISILFVQNVLSVEKVLRISVQLPLFIVLPRPISVNPVIAVCIRIRLSIE